MSNEMIYATCLVATGIAMAYAGYLKAQKWYRVRYPEKPRDMTRRFYLHVEPNGIMLDKVTDAEIRDDQILGVGMILCVGLFIFLMLIFH